MQSIAIDEPSHRADHSRGPLACALIGFALACAATQLHAGSLHEAIRAGDTPALEAALQAGTDVDATASPFGSALHVAIIMEDLEAIRLLHEHGADLETPNSVSGAHPLHLAAQIGMPPVVNLLVDLGADLEARDDLGRTPLIQAAIVGNSAATEILLSAGANADAAETRRGTTALHLAAFGDRRDVVDVLIAYGADIDAVDENGETALFWAIGNGHAEVITRLINAGADPAHRNHAGTGPLGAAAYSLKRDEIVRLLKSLGGK